MQADKLPDICGPVRSGQKFSSIEGPVLVPGFGDQISARVLVYQKTCHVRCDLYILNFDQLIHFAYFTYCRLI